jgi:hypothetical protein
MGHHAEQWRQEKQGGHDNRCGHHPCQLAAGTSTIVDGCLRGAASGRHDMEEAAGQVGHAGRH